MRYTDNVTEQDCSTDGRNVAAAVQVRGGHLPFDDLLRRCQQASFRFLYELTGFDGGLSTPHVEADLFHGIDVGPIEIDVTVERVGHTSFTLRCDVRQAETPAAVARFVLVSFDYEREAPVPLSSRQRDALEAHLIS